MKSAEEILKEMAWEAWKSAANAYRLYPDHKHTFADYWDGLGKITSKDLVTQMAQPLPVDGYREADQEPEINQWCLLWIGSEVPIVAIYKGGAKFIAHQTLATWEKEDITHWQPVPKQPLFKASPNQEQGEKQEQK